MRRFGGNWKFSELANVTSERVLVSINCLANGPCDIETAVDTINPSQSIEKH